MSTISASTTSTTAYKVTADTTGTLVLQTGATPTTAMTIDTSQNVGIGTSTLSGKFNVLTATDSKLIFNDGSTTGNVRLEAVNNAYSAYKPLEFNGSTLLFDISGAEKMRIDSSGKVGVGLSVLHSKFSALVDGVGGANNNTVGVSIATDGVGTTQAVSGWRFTGTSFTGIYGGNYAHQWVTDSANALATEIVNTGATPIVFGTSATERARIDSSGNLLIGCTSTPSSSVKGVQINSNIGDNFWKSATNTTSSYGQLTFINPNGVVGSITTSGSATSYVTSSDYRLKENIAPMTGALGTVAALKPCTYSWKSNGESTHGFIAHELQEVVPECVIGEKDAVDVEGNPVYQGIDTSFLIATLTAAIQELKAELDAAKADIATLKGAA